MILKSMFFGHMATFMYRGLNYVILGIEKVVLWTYEAQRRDPGRRTNPVSQIMTRFLP